jgi:hypothetical protein
MHIDGHALINAKRWSEKRFRELIQKYREAGAPDRQILNAMTASPAMIDCVGRLGNANAACSTQQKKKRRRRSDEQSSLVGQPPHLNMRGMIVRPIRSSETLCQEFHRKDRARDHRSQQRAIESPATQ